jgi:hypothetical protein
MPHSSAAAESCVFGISQTISKIMDWADLWECETCKGWFDFGWRRNQKRPLPAAKECFCPSPNIQQRFIVQEVRPSSAIERMLQECERILAEARAPRCGRRGE